MRAGPTDGVNDRIIARQQIVADDLLHRCAELLAQALGCLGQMLRHHVFGGGVDQIANPAEGVGVVANALAIAGRVERQPRHRPLRIFVAGELVRPQRPAQRQSFQLPRLERGVEDIVSFLSLIHL